MGSAPSSNTSPTTSETVSYEETNITWKVENFRQICVKASLFNAQQLNFHAGSRIGLLSEWTLYLQRIRTADGNWIGLFYKVKNSNLNDKLFSKISICIINVQGGKMWEGSTSIQNMALQSEGWGCQKMINEGSDLAFLVDGSLVLQVQHVLYARPAQIEYPTVTKGIEPESNKGDDADYDEQSNKKIKLDNSEE